jgi:tetratricopeptide (TPR) repeat protein
MKRIMLAVAMSSCLGFGLCTDATAQTKAQEPNSCAVDKTASEVMECKRNAKANDAVARTDQPLSKEQLDATVAACSKVLSGDHAVCSRADALSTIGQAYLAAGEPEKSVEYHSKAVLLRPRVEEEFVYRAKAYLKLHKIDEAIADLKIATVVDGSDEHGSIAYMMLGQVYAYQKDYDLAIDAITKAIERMPDGYPNIRSDFYKARGEYWSNKGDSAKAEADFAKAKELASNKPEQPLERETRQEPPTAAPAIATAPDDDAGKYWHVPNSCVPAWNYFRGKAAHGAFAVTKTVKNGGCGWSWSPTRPIESMRRQALATCGKYGSDCRIIGEK